MVQPLNLPIRRVDDKLRRRLFNEVEHILERVATGELIEVVPATYSNITSADEPPGTVGQMLSYRDPANNDFEVCRAYCYRHQNSADKRNKMPLWNWMIPADEL